MLARMFLEWLLGFVDKASATWLTWRTGWPNSNTLSLLAAMYGSDVPKDKLWEVLRSDWGLKGGDDAR